MIPIKLREKNEFRFQRAVKNQDSVSSTGNRHYHDLFEIYYLENGTCNYFIDDKSYESIQQECVEIIKLLTSIIKTTKSTL